MKSMVFFTLPFVTLLGCGEDDKSDDSSHDESAIEITNVDVSSTPCDGEMPPADSVEVTVESSGAVSVTHSNYEDSSCLGFEVEGALIGSTLTLSYIETGEPCDCTSMYSLRYDITGLASGSYELSFPGGPSEQVSID